MPYKDPTNWPWGVWLLAAGMSLAGGFINWYGRIKSGHIITFNILELIGELFTSGSVGVGVFMVLEALDQPIGICAAAAGIAGHMSTRLLFAVGQVVESRINTFITKKKKNG